MTDEELEAKVKLVYEVLHDEDALEAFNQIVEQIADLVEEVTGAKLETAVLVSSIELMIGQLSELIAVDDPDDDEG